MDAGRVGRASARSRPSLTIDANYGGEGRERAEALPIGWIALLPCFVPQIPPQEFSRGGFG